MPGIFGIVDTRGTVNVQDYLTRTAAAISHLPWHMTDTWAADDVPVGLGRSGIGIFNREPQPVTSEDGRLVLVMSGEFYRTEALRKALDSLNLVPRDDSHPELALRAFQAYGKDFAGHLEGAFIIAIYDRHERRLTLANDRFGMYPTYYAHEEGRLAFAPEVKGVLTAPFVGKRLNVVAMAEYFRFQHLMGNKTFHEGIECFPYGSVGQFDVDRGAWQIERYWDWDDIQPRLDVNFEEAVEEGGRLLREAVEMLSGDNLRPGVFLSGGLDSRTIIGFLSRRDSPPVSATFGLQNSRDVHYASQIARAVGSQHYWFDFPDGTWVLPYVDLHLKLTEGFHSWIHMHGISMLGPLREVMDVNLTGWDGGTVMGHREQIRPILNQPVDQYALMAELYRNFTNAYTWPGLTEAEERLLYSPQYKEAIGLAFSSFCNEFAQFEHFRLDNRAEYYYVRNHCFRLTQNMVTTARSHIEVRFPFWDYRLIDFIYAIRPEVRGHQQMYRAIITRELPRLAHIAYDKQEYLPSVNPLIHRTHAFSVSLRRRLGVYPRRPTLYADYEHYLRHELRSWAEDILFDSRTEARGILNMDFVRSIMSRHVSGREEWTIGKIAPLMTFEMMMRMLFD